MKPRNHLVKHAMFRKAGKHVKSVKSIRQQDKRNYIIRQAINSAIYDG